MSVKIQLRKTSLVDYPGRISSVIFFYGCNLRCPWCHNGTLVLGMREGAAGIEEAFSHIRKRRDVLGGIVLSGGEPCLCKELPEIIAEIKQTGLPVKLDTNGLFPSVLESLFRAKETRPDYIALDLKINPSRYGELAAIPFTADEIIQSAALIRNSGIDHEYRTLALPDGFITENDIEALAPLADSSPWYFRPFVAGSCLDPSWNNREEPKTKAEERAEALAAKARVLGKNGIARLDKFR